MFILSILTSKVQDKMHMTSERRGPGHLLVVFVVITAFASPLAVLCNSASPSDVNDVQLNFSFSLDAMNKINQFVSVKYITD